MFQFFFLDYNGLRTVFFYMMLTLVPLVLVLFLYSYYIRKSPSYFWKRNQRRTMYVPFVACCRCDSRDTWHPPKWTQFASFGRKWFHNACFEFSRWNFAGGTNRDCATSATTRANRVNIDRTNVPPVKSRIIIEHPHFEDNGTAPNNLGVSAHVDTSNQVRTAASNYHLITVSSMVDHIEHPHFKDRSVVHDIGSISSHFNVCNRVERLVTNDRLVTVSSTVGCKNDTESPSKNRATSSHRELANETHHTNEVIVSNPRNVAALKRMFDDKLNGRT